MTHVPDDLLDSFVEGDMGEHLAVHIAEHLDECAACATRAAAMEPMASAFASMDDPEPPATLAASALAAASVAERPPTAELTVGFALLACAGALVILAGNPVGVTVQLSVMLNLALIAIGAVSAQIVSSTFALSATTAAAVAGCAAAASVAVREAA
jgi:anti-sigma factor RsiW